MLGLFLNFLLKRQLGVGAISITVLFVNPAPEDILFALLPQNQESKYGCFI
jgi:hypothetical protein